jgi:hypothetical protein
LSELGVVAPDWNPAELMDSDYSLAWRVSRPFIEVWFFNFCLGLFPQKSPKQIGKSISPFDFTAYLGVRRQRTPTY